MSLKRNLTFVVIYVLAFVSANADVALWDIAPEYEKLNRYYKDIYAFQKNGKWGLVRSGNKIIMPASCDFITPFTNGYALAGVQDGNRYLLKYVVSEDGSVSNLSDRYYLPISKSIIPYVSEGKLTVVDRNGKYGYITPDGRTAVRCQFENALPFKEGWAPVRNGNYTMYISDTYDSNPSRSILTVDFHYGEMTVSGCFTNGKAVVAYNKDFALIGKNGQKIRKISETEFKEQYKNSIAPTSYYDDGFKEASIYSVITDNDGKCGLKEGDILVVSPQFDSFPKQFSDGAVMVMTNGRYGIIRMGYGDVTVSASSDELDVDRNGNISSVVIDYTIPPTLSEPKVFIDSGDGIFKDVSSRLSRDGINATLTTIPTASMNAESCVVRGFVENEGIRLAYFEKRFVLNYPVRLRMTAPGPSNAWANENDMATVSSTVFNDSNKQVTVTATWSTGKSVTVTIPSRGSRTISESFHIPYNCSKEVSVVLSTGERARSTINFHTFF